jgi:hypothetical protein
MDFRQQHHPLEEIGNFPTMALYLEVAHRFHCTLIFASFSRQRKWLWKVSVA